MPHSIPAVTAFQIILTKTPPVYYPGEFIQGTIQLDLTAAVAVQSIQAQLFSRSFSKIIELDKDILGDESDSSEVYLDDKITIWGAGKYARIHHSFHTSCYICIIIRLIRALICKFS